MIGVYDSGIGGVTVLQKLRTILPNASYYYFSDSKNNPYGEKSEQSILKIVIENMKWLVEKGCNPIVIACNTATTICISELRKIFPKITFIGIEPAIKIVYDRKLLGKTIVMATPSTLKSKQFLSKFEKYNTGNMILKPCPKLAQFIEDNEMAHIKQCLQTILIEKEIQNVVLGCTHYPIIKNQIKELLGNVNFFDGSEGVSKEVCRKIKEQNIPIKLKKKVEFYDSFSLEKEKRFREILNNSF